MSSRPGNPQDTLDQVRDLYESVWGRLVGLVSLAASSRQEAEDCVQEAFVRLLPVWPRVSAYDDPEAWLRQVALRQLSNRHRTARAAAKALLKLPKPQTQSVPGPDSLDITRALATLSIGQRQVVVLHYYVRLDLASIACELNVPLGTVKSRLTRARNALAPLLEEESSHA